MGMVNYWLFNMDYKNNDGDTLWEYCKKNNCFKVEIKDENKLSKSKTLKFPLEVKSGDYCVAYSGNKTIIGVGKVTRGYYIDDSINKKVNENHINNAKIGVKWTLKLEKELIIDKFSKSLGVVSQSKLSSEVCKINEEGYKYAKMMCDKIILLNAKNRFKKK